MSDQRQVSINSRIVREYAARIEARGYDGDAVKLIEALLIGAIADGWKPIEQPPPPRSTAELGGPGHREYVEARSKLANRMKEHKS